MHESTVACHRLACLAVLFAHVLYSHVVGILFDFDSMDGALLSTLETIHSRQAAPRELADRYCLWQSTNKALQGI